MSIAEKIQEKIRSHSVHMKPKMYFTLGAILLGLGAASAILLGIFFVAVIRFRLRVNAPFTYLAKSEGFTPFIQNIPWIPILVAIVGITFGIVLMKKFEFSYKHAFVGIAAGFFVAVIGLGILIDAVGLPEKAEGIRVLRPILHMHYQNGTWVSGTAVAPCEPDCIIETPSGDVFTIYVERNTEIIPPEPIMIGEWLRVIGEKENNGWEASVIMHQTSPRFNPRAMPYPKHMYRLP